MHDILTLNMVYCLQTSCCCCWLLNVNSYIHVCGGVTRIQCAYSFASIWQPSFLNQRKADNEGRKRSHHQSQRLKPRTHGPLITSRTCIQLSYRARPQSLAGLEHMYGRRYLETTVLQMERQMYRGHNIIYYTSVHCTLATSLK